MWARKKSKEQKSPPKPASNVGAERRAGDSCQKTCRKESVQKLSKVSSGVDTLTAAASTFQKCKSCRSSVVLPLCAVRDQVNFRACVLTTAQCSTEPVLFGDKFSFGVLQRGEEAQRSTLSWCLKDATPRSRFRVCPRCGRSHSGL